MISIMSLVKPRVKIKRSHQAKPTVKEIMRDPAKPSPQLKRRKTGAAVD